MIVDQIGRHADQGQIAAALPDNLVTRGKRNQVSEALQGDDIAVANDFLDRLFEWKNVRQTVIMARLESCRSGFSFLVFLVFIVSPLPAHHSTADYDLRHPASASGLVTRFEWSNPHARILLDAPGENGDVEHWIIEIDSPNALRRSNWTRDTLKPGDKVSCSGARAKDGSPRMRCTQVVLADGTVLQSF